MLKVTNRYLLAAVDNSTYELHYSGQSGFNRDKSIYMLTIKDYYVVIYEGMDYNNLN